MESCYSDKARHLSGLLCRNTEVMWNCAQKKKGLNSYPKICSYIMKMLQLIKHSLSKLFMAKHLLMDLKTILFTKFGPHWLLAYWNPHWKDKDFKTLKPLQEVGLEQHWRLFQKMSFINVSDSSRITGPRVQLLKETTLKITLSHSAVSIQEYLQ